MGWKRQGFIEILAKWGWQRQGFIDILAEWVENDKDL